MILKGEKRKFSFEDEEVGWENQRQLVLSMSFVKYQHGQELAEPSLRRQVLIANTLRQVSTQAPFEPWVASEPAQISTFGLQAKEQSSSNGSQTVDYVTDPARGAGASSEEDWASMSTDPDFELTAAVSSILTALDSPLDWGPQAAPRSPLRALDNLLETGWEKAGVPGCTELWEPQEASRMGSLNDVTMEELFHDIDSSLLESDVDVLGIRSREGGDELFRFLPPLVPSSDSFSIALNPPLHHLPGTAWTMST